MQYSKGEWESYITATANKLQAATPKYSGSILLSTSSDEEAVKWS